MSTLAQRLAVALKRSGKTKTDLWKGCDLSSGAISHWFNNPSTELKGKNLLCAARVLEVRAEWLQTGEGDADLSAIEKLINQINIALQTMREDDVKHVSDLCKKLTRESGSSNDERRAEKEHESERRGRRIGYATQPRDNSFAEKKSNRVLNKGGNQ